MLRRNNARNNCGNTARNEQPSLHHPEGIKFFHFDLSEKNHEIVLPVENETAWEQLHDITWDPGRGD